MSMLHSNGKPSSTAIRSRNEDAVFLRNESLRAIIRKTFQAQGAMPCQTDADLSTKLSEEAFNLIERTGAHGEALRRRVQLFATFALLTISECSSDVAPEIAAEFLTSVLGRELASTITEDDFKALDPINNAMKYLLIQPQWAAVHGGHIAMTCMSLLSLYDVSFLNWRVPQASGVRYPKPPGRPKEAYETGHEHDID
jgi:hypothetical protein